MAAESSLSATEKRTQIGLTWTTVVSSVPLPEATRVPSETAARPVMPLTGAVTVA